MCADDIRIRKRWYSADADMKMIGVSVTLGEEGLVTRGGAREAIMGSGY